MMLIKYLESTAADFDSRLESLLSAPAEDKAVKENVAKMLREIERNADEALLDYSERFDNFRPASAAGFEVSAEQLQAAQQEISTQLWEDLQTAYDRIREYHQHQLPQSWSYTDQWGNRLGETVKPVERAVIYAPGGSASYPSSVLMGVLPAQIAGVPEIILTTPGHQGVIPPITLAAAALAGCHRVFMLGGAQAIIGFALGTDTLPPADVIAGPGNAYVAEAKRQVFGLVGIDSIAGPSEVLIISDGSAKSEWVAADMIAQAEHDSVAQCILISDDAQHIKQVIEAISRLVPQFPRAEIIRQSLTRRGACILAENIDECCAIADDIAPEHLQIMTEDPEAVAKNINHAGAVFIGDYGSVAFGDYIAGTNHILPTDSTARFSSPLGVAHFMKRSAVFHASAKGAAGLSPAVSRLANIEGLSAHAFAAQLRGKHAEDKQE